MYSNEDLYDELIELIENHKPKNVQEKKFKELIKQGVNINQVDEDFETPLIKSIEAGNDTITNLLLDNGAQVNTNYNEIKELEEIVGDARRNFYSKTTPLQKAAQKGNINIVKRLIDKGARVNATDSSRHSALYYAIRDGNCELAKLLINNGANYEEYLPSIKSNPENKDIYDLIMKREQEKEAQRLQKREEYIEKTKQETKDIYPSQAIEAYVDLKMGSMAKIENLNAEQLDGLLQLYNRDKNKKAKPNGQQEITQEQLNNELAKDTRIYIRGVSNVTGLERVEVRTKKEYGGATEVRKLARMAGEPTLTKIEGAKTGNYNRSTTIVNSGKVLAFNNVGYGIIKENMDDIHMVGRYDIQSVVNKKNDTIIRYDFNAYGEGYDSEIRKNLTIQEEMDNILKYWKNVDMKRLKMRGKNYAKQYNEVLMNVSEKEVKFIYWSKESAEDSRTKELGPNFDKLQAVYFQRKYYEQTGRTLPIYEYKRYKKDFLTETKFTDKDIVNMLKVEILDKDKKSLKPKYSEGYAADFLMTFNNEISQIENSKEIVKQFVNDRLNEYSDKNNIVSVWDTLNVIKYAGIIMEGEDDKRALKETIKVVFNNLLETDTIMDFLISRGNGAINTGGKQVSEQKDIAAVVALLSEISEVAKDETMEFLNPELEEILKDKMMTITKDIKTNIVRPSMMLRALVYKDINLMKRIVEEGIDLNLECIGGKTILMSLAQLNYLSSETLKVLLDGGANINYVNSAGKTALMYAAEGKDYLNSSTLRILLNGGANINYVNSVGKTALMYAVEHNNIETVQYLLRRGASLENIVITKKTSPEMVKVLDYAYNNGNREKKIEKFLENKVKNINAIDEGGNTILTVAISRWDRQLANMVIDKGADINLKDGKGKSPMDVAIEINDARMVNFLIERGASLENVKINNETLPEIVEMLNTAHEKQNIELSQSNSIKKDDSVELNANKDNIKENINDAKMTEEVSQNDAKNSSKLKKEDFMKVKSNRDKIKVKMQSLKQKVKKLVSNNFGNKSKSKKRKEQNQAMGKPHKQLKKGKKRDEI